MQEIISLKNVTKKYNELSVVKDASFSIYKNEIVGLVGPNGAGKSTLISMIVGLEKPTIGEIKVNKNKVPNKNLSQNIGVMLQDVSMPEKLKVFELLEMVKVFCKESYSIDFVLKASGMEDEKNSYVNKLSGGKQRRLQFALSVIGKPEIIILDEPTVGLDFHSKNIFWNEINKMIDEGVTIILTSHDLKEIEDICTRVIVINDGQIMEDENIFDLRRKYASYSINFDYENIEFKESLLQNQNFFYYEISNKKVLIKTNDINKTVSYLLSLSLKYDQLDINKEALENIMTKIIYSEEV